MAEGGATEIERLIVRIMADGTVLERVLKQSEAMLNRWGDRVAAIGTRLTATLTLPLAALGAVAIKSAGDFEYSAARIQGAANLSVIQMNQMKKGAMDLTKQLGISPTGLVNTFGALIRGGSTLDQVMKGQGKAAAMLSKVGEVDPTVSAETVVKIMKVFDKDGMSATQAVNTLSAAADASVISISDMIQTVSQGSAVAAQAGVSFKEFSAISAMLGNSGIMGSDAGTGIKSFLVALTDSSRKADFKKFGISATDATGKMKPMRDIIAQMEKRLGGMTNGARLGALTKLFGTDAARIAATMVKGGAAGYDEMAKGMGEAMSVEGKFSILQNTFNGQLEWLFANLERIAIEIGQVLVPYMRVMNDYLAAGIEWWDQLNAEQKTFGFWLAAVAGAAGPFLVALGTLITLLGGFVGVLGTVWTGMLAFVSVMAEALVFLAAFIGWPMLAAAAVGALTLYVLDLALAFMGEDGLVGALITAWGYVRQFMYGFAGFMMNIRENWGKLTTWLGLNWYNILNDMGQLVVLFVANSILNWMVMQQTWYRLFAAFAGWMASIFMDMWTIDFWKAIGAGIAGAWRYITSFLTGLYDVMAGFASKMKDWLYNVLTGKGGTTGKGFMDTLLESAGKPLDLVGDAEAGLRARDRGGIMGVAGKILEEQQKKLVTGTNGFNPTTTALPEFNTKSDFLDRLLGIAPGAVEKVVKEKKTKTGGVDFTPPALSAVAAPGDTEKNKVGNTFGQISLKRIMLDGAGTKPYAKRTEVQAPAIEGKLDTLIDLTRQNKPMAAVGR